MKYRACLITVLVGVFVSACESSDSMDDSATENGAGMAAALGAIQGRVEAPAAGPSILMSDLQASEDFNFATSWSMDISFNLPMSNTYLSICTDYEKSNQGAVDVKFDSCVVRAPVTNGLYSSDDVPMTNALTSLVAVLIDYANPSAPVLSLIHI